MNMRLIVPLILLSFHLHGWAASRTLEDSTVHEILLNIKVEDCKTAVAHLKEGLAQEFNKVTLLAGSMYQEGLCVRRDWNKAVEFFLLARQQGNSQAVPKMVAGYALPANGPDVASALWWAQGGGLSPAPCRVPAEVHDNLDRFVETLSKWPKSTLDACNYTTGVTAAMVADMEYPVIAAAHYLKGRIRIGFDPAVPAFDVDTRDVEAARKYGMVDGDMLRDQNSSYATGSFKRNVLEAGEKVLKRYPRPGAIPQGMKTNTEFVFTILQL